MKKLRTLLPLLFTLLFMVSCGGSDEPNNPNGRYDWDVIETILVRKTGERSSTKYIVYDKTEEYMHIQKVTFEGKSDKYHGYLYIYNKRD